MSINPIRGEVTTKIGDVEVVLVADMNRLAVLSAATGRPTFHELYERLAGSEIDTVMQALRALTVRGVQGGKQLDQLKTLEAIWPHLDVAAVLQLRAPLTELLSSLVRPVKSDKTDNALKNGTSAQS